MAFYFNFVSTDTQLQAMKSILYVKHDIKYKTVQCLSWENCNFYKNIVWKF